MMMSSRRDGVARRSRSPSSPGGRGRTPADRAASTPSPPVGVLSRGRSATVGRTAAEDRHAARARAARRPRGAGRAGTRSTTASRRWSRVRRGTSSSPRRGAARRVIRLPSSASCAWRSIESRSPRSSPLARRSAMMRWTSSSRRRIARQDGHCAGVGSQYGSRRKLESRAPKSSARMRAASADVVGIAGDVGIEERLADDGLGQRHHLPVHLDDAAVLPAGQWRPA